VECSTHDGLIEINITVPDFEVEAAFRIGANPRFIVNRRPLTAEIGQGHQISRLTFLAFWKIELFHRGPPPNLKLSLKYTPIIYWLTRAISA
jgi:hypothetical protein